MTPLLYAIYHLLLPCYVLAALPTWLLKTLRRSGWEAKLGERIGVYGDAVEFAPLGGVLVHAVSVGETVLAMKLIRHWSAVEERRFILAVATPTAYQVARKRLPQSVELLYQPVDFDFLIRRYLRRFQPAQVVLVEGEMWPNLLRQCRRMKIPVQLVNARMSPRSQRRYRRCATWVRPVFCQLSGVALQREADREIWRLLGVANERIVVTGSMKFDPSGETRGSYRADIEAMLAAVRGERAVAVAASTHAGEELLIAQAVLRAGAFPVIVPRHAERRAEIRQALESVGLRVALRSDFSAAEGGDVLVVDSTGELKDWLEAAALVVIGKSFLARGGQNPAEAVLAQKPVIFGPHMENFEPLAEQLVQCDGAVRVAAAELSRAVAELLGDDYRVAQQVAAAYGVLQQHEGAVQRVYEWLAQTGQPEV